MFVPRHLLPKYSPSDAKRYQERWDDHRPERDCVFALIRDGAGEDFLQGYVDGGPLDGFLEDYLDLRGIHFFDEKIEFPDGDTFENIDFQHAMFHHSKLRNALFAAYLDYCRFYNCEFDECIFAMGSCFATTFEKCVFRRCDFARHFVFTNCDFIDCEFESYTAGEALFRDCRFDAQTLAAEPSPEPFRMAGGYAPDSLLQDPERTTFYGEIEAAYQAGKVPSLRKKYHLLARQAFGRHNAKGFAKASNLVNRYVAGYGVRVQAPILLALIVVIGFAIGFVTVGPRPYSSAEAFGVVSRALTNSVNAFAGLPVESASGNLAALLVSAERLLGLIWLPIFITVLANVWFRFRD